MKKVAVVILNYCNYRESELCVESAMNQTGIIVEIIIVDNGSPNASYEKLANKYKDLSNIHVLRVHKNYGFAKGNNIGIHYARNMGVDFVLLLNSDIVLKGEDCIKKLISDYEPGVGVIGARIIERNGKEKQAYSECIESPEKWWLLFYFLSAYLEIESLRNYFQRKMESGKKTEILHGSNLLLTPDYLAKCGLLYQHTFLYSEEILLYFQCRDSLLEQKVSSQAIVFHKGAQSSRYLYKNESRKSIGYRLKSYVHVLLYPVLKRLDKRW